MKLIHAVLCVKNEYQTTRPPCNGVTVKIYPYVYLIFMVEQFLHDISGLRQDEYSVNTKTVLEPVNAHQSSVHCQSIRVTFSESLQM